MKIRVECSGSETVKLDELVPLQGTLKVLEEEQYQQIAKSIRELGFSFPVFMWKLGNKKYIIDAHQRFTALKRMRDEGDEIPKLPAVVVNAKNKKEAAKKILAASAQYGKITPDTLNKFIVDFGLDTKDVLKDFRFPEIDVPSFNLTFGGADKFDPHSEWNDMPDFDQQNKKAFRSVIVHFVDQKGVDDFAELIKQDFTDKTKYCWYPEVENVKAIDKRWM